MFNKPEIFFLRILLPFIVGITLFYNTESKLFKYYFEACIAIIIVILLYLYYIKSNKKPFQYVRGLLILTGACIAGGLNIYQHSELRNENHFSKLKLQILAIQIDSEPHEKNQIFRFKARVLHGYLNNKYFKTSGNLSVALVSKANSQTIRYGDIFLIPANYKPVEPPNNPGEFDFKYWLANQRMYHQIFLNVGMYRKTTLRKGNKLVNYAYNLRTKLVQIFKKNMQNPDSYSIASTLILGYKADLDKEVLSAYSNTGTIHALSVSGAHVAIIYYFLSFLFRFLDRQTYLKIVKLILICSILWFYALLTGFSPAVLRAVLMITAFIAAKSFSRNVNSLNILAFSAFCMLVYNPLFLFDIGFQLSFLAVFGMLYLQPIIYNLFYFNNKYLDKLWNFTALSIAAQFITYPLSSYYFHQFPLYFLIGNLFIMLPINLIMGLGILLFIPKLEFLGYFLDRTIFFTNEGLKWISNLPCGLIEQIYFSKSLLIVLCLSFLFFFVAVEIKDKKQLWLSVFLFACFIFSLTEDKIHKNKQKIILFFSLKKGYATAFLAGRSAVLITNIELSSITYLNYIKPALNQYKINNIISSELGKEMKSLHLEMDNQQIYFYKYKILILDSFLNTQKIKNKPSFSSIWINGKSKIDLQKLKEQINSKALIVDATTNFESLNNITNTYKKLGYSLNVLKKNPAYLIDLK